MEILAIIVILAIGLLITDAWINGITYDTKLNFFIIILEIWALALLYMTIYK